MPNSVSLQNGHDAGSETSWSLLGSAPAGAADGLGDPGGDRASGTCGSARLIWTKHSEQIN